MTMLDKGRELHSRIALPLQARAVGSGAGAIVNRTEEPKYRSGLLLLKVETNATIADLNIDFTLQHSRTTTIGDFATVPEVEIPSITAEGQTLMVQLMLDGDRMYHRLTYDITSLVGTAEVVFGAEWIVQPDKLPVN